MMTGVELIVERRASGLWDIDVVKRNSSVVVLESDSWEQQV
jgi:hypothetical protein